MSPRPYDFLRVCGAPLGQHHYSIHLESWQPRRRMQNCPTLNKKNPWIGWIQGFFVIYRWALRGSNPRPTD